MLETIQESIQDIQFINQDKSEIQDELLNPQLNKTSKTNIKDQQNTKDHSPRSFRKSNSSNFVKQRNTLQEKEVRKLKQARSQILQDYSFSNLVSLNLLKNQQVNNYDIFQQKLNLKSQFQQKDIQRFDQYLKHTEDSIQHFTINNVQNKLKSLQDAIYNLAKTNDKLKKEISKQKDQKDQKIIEQIIEIQSNLINKIKEDQIYVAINNEQIGLQETIKVLKKEIQTLQAKLKSQDIFFSMIIHDMRNPINAVISMAENIQQEFDQENQRVQKLK